MAVDAHVDVRGLVRAAGDDDVVVEVRPEHAQHAVLHRRVVRRPQLAAAGVGVAHGEALVAQQRRRRVDRRLAGEVADAALAGGDELVRRVDRPPLRRRSAGSSANSSASR